MLSLLLTVFAIAAGPSPTPVANAPGGAATPSATASDTPRATTSDAPPAGSQLKQIGHVEAHSACEEIVTHANGAIAAALANDGDFALTVNRLRTSDLDDDNEIHRRNETNDLLTLAGRIRMAAAAGNRDVKELRAIIARTAQPQRKAELKAFTDALSGAIARQRIAATNLDKLLVIVDGERATAEADATERENDRVTAGPGQEANGAHPGVMRPALMTPPPRIDPMLRTLADDFAAQTQAILADEATAAQHTDGATSGC